MNRRNAPGCTGRFPAGTRPFPASRPLIVSPVRSPAVAPRPHRRIAPRPSAATRLIIARRRPAPAPAGRASATTSSIITPTRFLPAPAGRASAAARRTRPRRHVPAANRHRFAQVADATVRAGNQSARRSSAVSRRRSNSPPFAFLNLPKRRFKPSRREINFPFSPCNRARDLIASCLVKHERTLNYVCFAILHPRQRRRVRFLAHEF